ncbi:MAG: CBS domain-containing protein [Alphaproteobacteria bacterium]|nr:CBS domain-containing protein [Alphaproteobacteria bacterium]
MKASDVMTGPVVSVTADTPISDLINLMLRTHISGVPVTEPDGTLAGIVTEGDLIRRAELGTQRKRGAWREFFTGTATLAEEYVRSHGTKVRDVMTTGVVAVSPETPLTEIADLMEERRIRRVPVVENNKAVGIVSRANLLRAWASQKPAAPTHSADDTAIRNALLAELGRQSWSRRPENSVIVTDGVVHLWGLAATEEEKRAIELAAERTPGVRAVQNHIVELSVEPYPLIMGA